MMVYRYLLSVVWHIFMRFLVVPAVFLLQARHLFSRPSAMQRIKSDGLGGRGVTFIPSSGKYNSVVIWMHGLGDTADGWASMMPGLGLSNTKFILPTAPNRPISLNGGMPMPGWSDIYGLTMSDREDRAGFEESAARINEIIQKEVDGGLPASKIVVGGFSQGGAVALHTTLRSTHTLGGCVALSTWLPLRADFPAAMSPAAGALPILQVHGDSDQVVGHRWGHESHKLLKSMVAGAEPRFATIEGMGHSSDEEEMELVRRFLRDIVDK